MSRDWKGATPLLLFIHTVPRGWSSATCSTGRQHAVLPHMPRPQGASFALFVCAWFGVSYSHVRPRPTQPHGLRPAELASHFRCPSGPYLNGRADRTPRLQRHIHRALSRSLVPSVLDAPIRASQNVSIFYTRESAIWPKPARCQARRASVCQYNPHFCLILPQGNSPRTSLISERHGIEFRQVWKVASSSLASFFYCNMWGDLRAEKLLPSQALPVRLVRQRVVVPSREPISRFVASSFEVLERLLNHVSPSGQRMPDEMYAEPSGPFAPTVLRRSTRWFEPLERMLNGSSAAPRLSHVYDIVNGFVEDVECNIAFSAAEHLASQMSFVTSGYAERASLDFQIRLSNVTTDLERLGERISYPPSGNGSLWKCSLGRENEGAAKAKLALSKDDFNAVLTAHPSLTQRLCTVYFQDFLCLGFQLPPECEGGKELQWAMPTGPRTSLATG